MTGFESLLGGGGGAAAQAMNLDVLAPEGGLLRKRGKVMFHSTFEGGDFQGWRDHYGTGSPSPAVGLTKYPVMSGSHAMMLSTGSVPYFADNVSNSSGTYKNLSFPREKGLVSFSGFFAQASDASNTAGSQDVGFDNVGLFFDTQSWADVRRFYRASLTTRAGSATPAWMITTREGQIVVPNTGNITGGINERKWNFNYWRLTIDLAGGPDGLGGYVELQVNSRTFDLRAYAPPIDAPQAGSAMDSFAGGFNPGLAIARSYRVPEYTENAVVFDDLVVTFNDVRNY
ncbi:hypothetical protein [Pseudoclavibacter sp. 8L]|uniref:hypothetical protein n=1 Tax=Pseudoclavibacter sp. 8L TaxID=2653162 RepID=UPI0012F3169A|nr:hypothetical protein [Pseudoclavibacter sp. 8L]VXB32315.1 putative ATP-dependent helicase HrpB [Pseudoclavibacter sp. 8L]